MSISASWLVLAVLILRFILKKAPKWVNVLLWGLVAIRLICPFSIESRLSLIPDFKLDTQGIVSVQLDAAKGQILDSEGNVLLEKYLMNESEGFGQILDFNGKVIQEKPLNQNSSLVSVGTSDRILPIIWMVGMFLMLGYSFISYIYLKRKVATATQFQKGILLSEHVSSPFVLGIVRPMIYLPYGMGDKHLYHVVAHEQAHIRRLDHWWKPLGFLLLTVYWFNPLMWLAYILLCRDIELACDEKVIAELGNEQRANYTQALVACAVNRRMIAACPLAFGEVGVKDRVKSIMNYRKPTFWIIVTALVVCLVVAVCFLTDPVHHTNEASYLNYKNSISISMRQDVVPAVHYSSEKDQGSIGIGMVEGSAFAEYLDQAQWREKRFVPSDLSSPGSIAVNLAENLRITVYDRNFAAVKFNTEVCYYRIAKGDYDTLLNLLMPADEERLEKSSETRPELVLGIGTIDPNIDGISFGTYDLEGDYAGITEIRIRNLHNGSDSTITNQDEIQLISDFIARVQGTNPMSSKGYYGGSYSLDIYNGSNKIFSIGFGDDESFNYGDYGDGYPTRYDLRGVTREEVIRFFSQFDSSDFDWGLYKFSGTLNLGLNAEIIEVDSANRILYVKDIDKRDKIFGDRCAIDCSYAISRNNLVYVNYDDPNDVRTIEFNDFEIGDSIIIGMYDSEKQKAFNGNAVVEQIQLSTQRVFSDITESTKKFPAELIYEKYLEDFPNVDPMYMDLNEDGEPELIMDYRYSSTDLAIVTIEDGEPVMVLKGSRIFLCEDGIIGWWDKCNGGETLSYFRMEGQSIVFVEVFVHLYNEPNWYHSFDRKVPIENMDSITKEEGLEICAQHRPLDDSIPAYLTNFYLE